MVLLSMESPAGSVVNSQATNVEALRVVMSQATFAEVTHLFADQLKKMEAETAAQQRVQWPVSDGDATRIHTNRHKH